MKIANVAGRLTVAIGDGGVEVEPASNGRFGPDVQSVYDRWEDMVAWADGLDPEQAESLDTARLAAPSPTPRQVFAIGLDYSDHAAEAGFNLPEDLPPTSRNSRRASARPMPTSCRPVTPSTGRWSSWR